MPSRAVDKQTVEAEAWDGVMADIRYCTVSAAQWEAQATPGMGREVFKSFKPNISILLLMTDKSTTLIKTRVKLSK